MKRQTLISTFFFLSAFFPLAQTLRAQGNMSSPKFSEAPIPCHLTMKDLPAFFGTSMDMPITGAKKLFGKYLRSDVVKMDFPFQVKPGFYRVAARGLPKSALGIPVQEFQFANTFTEKVDSLAVRFADRQTLSSEKLFQRITEITGIAPDLWLLVDHGNGAHMSWRAHCTGFRAQFDAQKGMYYRLWLTKTIEFPDSKTPTGDGE